MNFKKTALIFFIIPAILLLILFFVLVYLDKPKVDSLAVSEAEKANLSGEFDGTIKGYLPPYSGGISEENINQDSNQESFGGSGGSSGSSSGSSSDIQSEDCVDPDNGLDPKIPTYSYQGENKGIDYCYIYGGFSSDCPNYDCYVYEHYCENNQLRATLMNCVNGCFAGACLD